MIMKRLRTGASTPSERMPNDDGIPTLSDLFKRIEPRWCFYFWTHLENPIDTAVSHFPRCVSLLETALEGEALKIIDHRLAAIYNGDGFSSNYPQDHEQGGTCQPQVLCLI